MKQNELENKISNMIFDAFDYVYCNNCRFSEEDSVCEGCHRKSMSWEVSRDYANAVAKAIMVEVKGETNEL